MRHKDSRKIIHMLFLFVCHNITALFGLLSGAFCKHAVDKFQLIVSTSWWRLQKGNNLSDTKLNKIKLNSQSEKLTFCYN